MPTAVPSPLLSPPDRPVTRCARRGPSTRLTACRSTPGSSENPHDGATTTTDLLAGKTILITGASSGIGESSAHLFAREGANVVVTARRKPEFDRAAGDITAEGGNALAVQADTTNADELQRAVAAAVEKWGASRPE
ncbi:SDR family NAD(P)-dependent oxidoreductase [Streptomyces sp. NBC_01744]|uniref:SDR family NAD(P)-dependent oxidoreductase n=1 Tax=unclassified Streptomyces TaxID=2593676 RepID=UPI003D9AAA26